MYKKLAEVPKCVKCGRTCFPIDEIKEDPKTKKKWYIRTCPRCGYESDLEEANDINPFK